MELKKIREIRNAKEYLPGFVGGFDPVVPGFGGWQWRNNIYNSVFNPAPNGGIPEQWQGPTPGIVEGNVNGIKNLQFSSIIKENAPAQGVTPGSILTPSDNTIKTKLQEPLKRVDNGTPKSTGGPSAASIGNIVTSGLGFMGSVMNSFGPTLNEQELLANAGTSRGNVNGFGYQKQNAVDANRELDELKKENTANTLNTAATGATLGASVGSIIPGVGTAIGGAIGAVGGFITGLFGGSSRKARLQRKIFNANQQAIAKNNFNRASAHSDFLAQDYAYNHANTQDDILYGAKHGKDMFSLMPGYVLGKDVYTAGGLMSGPANSRVAFGETIYEPSTGEATIVRKGKLNKDANLANLAASTVVFGKDVDKRTGKTFRDEALPIAAVLEKLNKI